MARWLPMESNPNVMNKFLIEIGVPEQWKIMDVYGLDPELLAMIPRPVAAVILLYPLTEKSTQYNDQEESMIKSAGQVVSKNVFYLKQYVSNACGTVALVHSVANNVEKLKLNDGIFKQFINENKGSSAEEVGKKFENNSFLASIHDKLAREGQTATPERDAKVDKHFIALVSIDNCLYELDGRKNFPVNHGKTDEDSFLVDCGRVCRDFMTRDPEESNFAIVALALDDE